ncbi:MAG: electron transfer flavoprotein subunit alpha/FixB family protein [Erysipelotrichia bacterium]|jgi:electron transfer flavoprotein alpha subunit|nr:electron transfer flavoprotein subunit alpha/FixB family protein [Erysipelotrichia bacterium]
MNVKDIFVYIEVREDHALDAGFQLLSLSQTLKEQYAAKGIAQEVVAVICGHHVEQHIADCHKYGADKVIIVDHEVLRFPTTEAITSALAKVIETYHPECFLVGATVVGRDIAPRVAARVGTGLTADATHLEVDPSEDSRLLLMTRPAFGGNLYGTIICPFSYPQMSSIRPEVFVKVVYDKPVADPIRLDFDFKPTHKIEVLERLVKHKEGADLKSAHMIVAGGRSMVNHIEKLQNFASKIDASFAASRGLVESGKVGKDIQVGQTGVSVRPALYIACGISGAAQHTAGMENAQTIIAINTDPEASIFQFSHLGVVGDAIEVLKRVEMYL